MLTLVDSLKITGLKYQEKCEIRVDKRISVSNNILHILTHINVHIKKLLSWYMEIVHGMSNYPKIMEKVI